jgi:molecular chaperone GrpE
VKLTSQKVPEQKPHEVSSHEKKETSVKRTFVPASEVRELHNALEEEKKKSEEYLTRLKYLQADFENLQKRSKREMDEAIKYGETELALDFLPVLDDLERALVAGKSSDNKEAIIGGLEMILKTAQNILSKRGLSPIDAVGKKFDPTKHEAAGFVSSPDCEDNMVVKELRKGYVFGDKVIRPSIVEVARKTSPEQAEGSS